MPRAGWAALGAVAAALAANALGTSSAMALLAVAIAATIATGPLAIIVPSWRSRTAFRGAAPAVAGVALIAARLTLGAIVTSAPADPGPPPPGPHAWHATVLATRPPRDGTGRATLRLQPVRTDPAWPVDAPDGPWDVWATLPRAAVLVAGDRIALRAAVTPVPDDGSGFARFLLAQDLAGTIRVDALPVAEAGAGSPVERLRLAASDAIGRALPAPEAGLAAGVLIGIRDGLAPSIAADFATTGLGHMVAISGWNIAVVAGTVMALLGATGVGRRPRSLLAIVAIAGYALASGASASVLRAAVMGGAAIAARASGRPGSAAAVLGVTVTGLLVADPAIASDIGFQLSAAATAGLLAWGEPFTERLRRIAGGRLPGWLAETLGVSFAAQAATLPIVLLQFGRLSTISPVANLVAAPFAAPAMAVSLGGLLAGAAAGLGVPPVILAPVALAGRLVLGGLIEVTHRLAGVPFASVTLPSPLDLVAAAASVGLLAVTAHRMRGRRAPIGDDAAAIARGSGQVGPVRLPGGAVARRAMALGTAGLLLAGGGMLVAAGRAAPRLAVTVLDVGQGDAVLVEGPGGSRILVDGGPDPDRLLTRLDARLPPWDRRIDLLVLSHPHEDHVAGLATLIARYRIGRVAENGMRGSGPGDQAFLARLVADGRLVARLAAGDRIGLDGVGIEVRWPPRGSLPERAPSDGRAVNDTSIVLDLRWGERRFLLMGDVEDDVDPRLLADGIGAGGRVDLLKVAHHGSATATSDAFLAATRPLVAVASAGLGNPYGHPSPRTLARIAATGATVLRTDADGSVTVSTDGSDLRVEGTGPDPAATPPARRTGSIDGAAGAAGPAGLGGAAGSARDERPAGSAASGPTDTGRTAAVGSIPTARAWSLLDRLMGPCRIPGARPPVRMAGDPVRRPGPRHDRAATGSGAIPAPGTAPCYDRRRGDPLPRRVGAPPPRARSARRADPPHGGRRGDRELPRRTGGGPRRRGRPPPRGGRRLPP